MLNVYSNIDCTAQSKLIAPYCSRMIDSINAPTMTEYNLPSTLLASNILNIYILKLVDNKYEVIKLTSSEWQIVTTSRIRLLNVTEHIQPYNRVIFIPYGSFNLCFTGIEDTLMSSTRLVYLKRDLSTKMYDYLYLTSVDYAGLFPPAQTFNSVTFNAGVGNNFINMTSEYTNCGVFFNAEYVGKILEVTGVSSVQLDRIYSNSEPMQAIVYSQGSLEFSFDYNGSPTSWSSVLKLNPIDTDDVLKIWVRDFKTISAVTTAFPNNAIYIVGTEFTI